MSGKAEDLMRQAEKKATSGGGFFGMFSDPTRKAEEAAELYKNAAIQFKIMKDFKQAGQAYILGAEQFMRAEQPHEAASLFNDAATSLKKDSVDESLNCMSRAAETYMDMGRFAMAARQYKNMAELQEQKDDKEGAMDSYQKAIDSFEAEDSESQANKLKAKLAELKASSEMYTEAFELFEEVGGKMIDNKLLVYGAKEYFLKAGICRLATGDEIATKRAVDRYSDGYPQFDNTREQRLLQSIVQAKEEDDEEAFTEALREYDEIQKLSPWHTTILLKIKKSFEAGEDDGL
eukprot:m.240015 g.240015  ORF g.240015 m.240015 type:complete len:291 (-) comp14368_c0_seq1:166-1038(-)